MEISLSGWLHRKVSTVWPIIDHVSVLLAERITYLGGHTLTELLKRETQKDEVNSNSNSNGSRLCERIFGKNHDT